MYSYDNLFRLIRQGSRVQCLYTWIVYYKLKGVDIKPEVIRQNMGMFKGNFKRCTRELIKAQLIDDIDFIKEVDKWDNYQSIVKLYNEMK